MKIEVKSRLAILEKMGPAGDFTIKQSLSRVELGIRIVVWMSQKADRMLKIGECLRLL